MGIEKEPGKMWSRGKAPAAVFRSMLMNYFDRDNQDEM